MDNQSGFKMQSTTFYGICLSTFLYLFCLVCSFIETFTRKVIFWTKGFTFVDSLHVLKEELKQ